MITQARFFDYEKEDCRRVFDTITAAARLLLDLESEVGRFRIWDVVLCV